MEWDSNLGIWKGSKAVSIHNLPSPLYIYGYGSLLWRPGDLLSKYKSYPCICYNWKRLFVQKSMDHRGTIEFPGYVATLVSDDYLNTIQINNLNNNQQEQEQQEEQQEEEEKKRISECVGIVFLVPQEEAEKLIDELDFREKGGYHRHIISVKLLEKTEHHEQYDIADALVYTGPIDNPNFSLDYSNIHWERVISRVISAAIGPSGDNAEYLLQLVAYVNQQEVQDEHLNNLSQVVYHTMCPWRSKLIIYQCNQLSKYQNQNNNQNNNNIVNCSGPYIIGWGSDETSQLSGCHSISNHFTTLPIDLSSICSNDLQGKPREDLVMSPTKYGYFSTESPNQQSLLLNPKLFHYQVFAGGSRSAVLNYSTLYMWGDIVIHQNDPNHNYDANLNQNLSNLNHFPQLNLHQHQYFSTQKIKCWKKSFYLVNNNNTNNIDNTDNNIDNNTITNYNTIKLTSLESLTFIIKQKEIYLDLNIFLHNTTKNSSFQSISINNVTNVSMGHSHNLVLLNNHQNIISFGDNSYFKCSDENSNHLYENNSNLQNLESLESLKLKEKLIISKLATGLNHSIILSRNGLVYSWGDNSYQQVLESSNNPFILTKSNSYIVDIECGCNHSILIDNHSYVYTFGSNRYGQLGREVQNNNQDIIENNQSKKKKSRICCSTPTEVNWKYYDLLVNTNSLSSRSIKWNKISCGWNHTILQGITLNGEIVFAGWGRYDMGQLPVNEFQSIPFSNEYLTNQSILYPIPIITPSYIDGKFVEMWCGSEYTIACTDKGELWSRGWREHGNLGHGNNDEYSRQSNCLDWVKVSNWNNSNNNVIWSGKLACGGAHCISLID